MTRFTPIRAALLATVLAVPMGAFAQTAVPTAPAAPSAPMAQSPAVTTPGVKSPDTAAATPAAPAVKHEARVEQRVEHRIEELHSKLKITPAQQPAFDSFAGVMRDNARAMETNIAEHRAAKPAEMTAVDRMQSFAQHAEARAQDAQKLVGPFQTLYGQLSPEQKRTADQLFNSYAEHAKERFEHHRG